jgi:hypothetical protein
MDIKTNLVKMKRTYRPPETGDIFYLQIPLGQFIFGRVRFANAPRTEAPMPGAHLIYIYDWKSSAPSPDYSMLRKDKLLIAPVWTNRMSWTKGYFQHVENQAGHDKVVFGDSCFRAFGDRFLDQKGRSRSTKSEPCGEWGLVSYRWIDDRVSDALGIPRVPED